VNVITKPQLMSSRGYVWNFQFRALILPDLVMIMQRGSDHKE